MAEFKPNRGNVRALLRSKQLDPMLTARAQPMAARIRSDTPKSNRAGGGGTAASTKVESPDRGLDGRRRVKITQTAYTGRNRPRGGAAAPMQFGNRVTEQRSHMTRGLQVAGS